MLLMHCQASKQLRKRPSRLLLQWLLFIWDLTDGPSSVVSSKHGQIDTYAGERTVVSKLKALRNQGQEEQSVSHMCIFNTEMLPLSSRSTRVLLESLRSALKGKLFHALTLSCWVVSSKFTIDLLNWPPCKYCAVGFGQDLGTESGERERRRPTFSRPSFLVGMTCGLAGVPARVGGWEWWGWSWG